MARFSDAAIRRNRERWPYAHLLAATDGGVLIETVHGFERGLREEVETSARRIEEGKPYPGGTGWIPGSILVDGLPGCVWMPWIRWDAASYEAAITAKLPADPTRRYQLRVHPRAYHLLMVCAYEKTLGSAASPALDEVAFRPDGRGLAEVRIDPSLPESGWLIRSTDDGPFVGDRGVLRGPRS